MGMSNGCNECDMPGGKHRAGYPCDTRLYIEELEAALERALGLMCIDCRANYDSGMEHRHDLPAPALRVASAWNETLAYEMPCGLCGKLYRGEIANGASIVITCGCATAPSSTAATAPVADPTAPRRSR